MMAPQQCFPLMTASGSRILRGRSSSVLQLRLLGLSSLTRCISLLLCWGLLLGMHQPTLVVRAQFAADPFPLLIPSSDTIVLNGDALNDQSGASVSGVGDMNGDGVDDFVVGAPGIVSTQGKAYLMFGRNASTPWTPNPLDLSSLDGANGVIINGVTANAKVGFVVTGVKDVNGDSINDLLIGSQQGDVAYLVFGVNGTWPASVDLVQDAFNGVTFVGETGDGAGYSVSAAGDVNHDGIPDMAIGVYRADGAGGTEAGRMDVLYGRDSGSPWPSTVTLSTYVISMTGFSVLGDNGMDFCGYTVAGVGDVNGDGVDDVAVTCSDADPNTVDRAGIVAVVFGSSTALPNVMPSELDGTNGFVVSGQRAEDEIGTAVTFVGDVNADGLDDFAIGAPIADANALVNSGEAYVLFGRNASSDPWPNEVSVSALDGTGGFTLVGSMANDRFGTSLSPAGDVNGDGIDDFLVSASLVNSGEGLAFLLYGRAVWPATQNANDLYGNNSTTFEGGAMNDFCGSSVALLGDVNGDGRSDLAVGCSGANPGSGATGQTSVVFGPSFTAAPTTAAPTTTSPTTAVPTTAVPTTAAPTTAVPTTAVPTTAAPTTAAPTTAAPTTAAPSTPSPTTTSPTTASPSTPAPTTTMPTTASPTTVTPSDPGPTASPITIAPTTPPTTASPTTSPTMPEVTASPTSTNCASDGAFIPPGAGCVNGILVTSTNLTTPADTTVTVATSITVTGGSSFEQSSGSTLVFVADGSSGQGSTSIAVDGGGCATIGGDAVVEFATDPSNGGVDDTTDTLVLVTADCVMGSFGSITATTSFEGDECVAVGDAVQQSSGSSISVSFGVSNACDGKSGGLSTGALVGIIVGVSVVTGIIVVVFVKFAFYMRNKRAQRAVRMSSIKGLTRTL